MESIKINNETLTYNKIWYIDQNTGNDTTGDGSKYNPFKTIQKGIDSSSDGDQIRIYDGLYEGQLNDIGFLHIEKSLDFIGSGLNTIIKSSDYNTIQVKSTTNVIVNFIRLSIKSEGTTASGSGDSYQSIILLNGTQYTTVNFYNCYLLQNGNNFINFYPAGSNNTINIINSIFNNTSNSINVYSLSVPVITSNKINFINSISLSTQNEGNESNTYRILSNFSYGIYKKQLHYFRLSNSIYSPSITSNPDYLFDNTTFTGNPSILNPNGTRSNIGIYGGPYQFGVWFKYLLSKDNSYFTIDDNNTIQPVQISTLTGQDFDTYGFAVSNIDCSMFNNLADYKLLVRSPTASCNISTIGIYKKPIVLKTINLIDTNILKISNINLNYTVTGTTEVGFLTSFDNNTWYYYDGTDFQIQDIENPTNLNTKSEIENYFIDYDCTNIQGLYFQIFINSTDTTNTFKLNSIDLNIINDSQLRIFISTDNDEWLGYDLENNQTVQVDLSNKQDIFKYGLDISTLNTISDTNSAFWNDLASIANKLKFQFYLSINDTTETIKLDNLSLQADINGTWKLQEKFNYTDKVGDYDIELTDKMLRVNIFSDGSYKVNYNFIDTTPPKDLIVFTLKQTAYNNNIQVKINWVPPTDYDYSGVVIMRKKDSQPTDIFDGQRIYPILPQDSGVIVETNENEIMDSKDIDVGENYFYRQFPYDIRYNYNQNNNDRNVKNIIINSIIDDGLVAYYPFNIDQNDHSGNDHDAILNNAIIENNYVYTNGDSTSYVDFGPLNYNYDQGITIILNVYFNKQTPSNGHQTFIQRKGYTSGGFQLQYESNKKIRIQASGSYQNSDNTIEPNNWYNLIFVSNASGPTMLYINGIKDSHDFTTPTLQVSNDFMWHLAKTETHTQPTDAYFNNVIIYNRQLTESEIQFMYTHTKM